MKKRALIFGITGQDGSYLSELLLEKDYEVFGAIRRHSTSGNLERIQHILDYLNLEYSDLTDAHSVETIIQKTRPMEVFNLAAQSHVGTSFDVPDLTMQINGVGVLNILESCKRYDNSIKIYQASTSEIFGNNADPDGFQREGTPTHPVSPYGCAKLFAYNLIRHYRKAYNMFACNGILFNHESPRRGHNFVTTKIIKTAVEIKLGLADKLVLGNLDSFRDWGHAQDYCRAMRAIMSHDKPDDFVVSTMKAHCVRDLCQYVFEKLGLNYQDYVSQDSKFLRPEELKCLKGDSTKIRTTLGWEPEYTFEMLIDEMIDFWMKQLNNRSV